MTTKPSIATLQTQYAFQLNVHIRKGEKLTGSFGKTIYKAEWIDQRNSPIVLLEIKEIKTSDEVLLYISLEHKHIIKTYGLVQPTIEIINAGSILLLQEYAKDGDLGRLLNERFFIPSQSVLLEIFIQIVKAMIYLSEHNIIHGDLACRNVLVVKCHPYDLEKNLVKLIDFGLTRDESIPLDTKIEFPERYAALEIIRSKGRFGYSIKSDVYSFAVLMWEGYSPEKRMPYDYISSDEEVCRRKLNGERLTQPGKCPSDMWILMNRCWNDRPHDRPDFQMIHTQLEHIHNPKKLSTTSNPVLINTQYNFCHNCDLPYTDYDAHQNICSELEIACHICFESHRRTSLEEHMETCNNSVYDIRNKSLSFSSTTISLNESEKKYQGPCEYCNKQYHIDQLYNHETNCLKNPENRLKSLSFSSLSIDRQENHNQKITCPDIPQRLSSFGKRSCLNLLPPINVDNMSHSRRQSPPAGRFTYDQSNKTTTRTSVQNKQSQQNTTQLPCEICKLLFDISQLENHQKECDNKDRTRLENMRREIEQEKNFETVQCAYCQQIYLTNEITNHEKTCRSKIDNQRTALSRTHSSSTPNIYRNLSDNNNNPKNKKNGPSAIRKFLSRLLPFIKK